MKGRSSQYAELREFCEATPIIDCHDHSGECGPKYADPLAVVSSGYFGSDLASVLTDEEDRERCNTDVPWEERWPLFEKAWNRTGFTGYAQVTRLVLKKFYGIDELTFDALKSIEGKLLDLTDPRAFDDILAEAGIAARLEDCWADVRQVIDGSFKMSPRGRLIISLPGYHSIKSYDDVQQLTSPVDRSVSSLDEYLAACRRLFEAQKTFGAVAFKDQSAYNREICYDNPTRHEAESVFNWFMEDPRRNASYPDQVKPLSDYLFHEFMRIARDMDLPVQIHTGHMAGIRNEISKTNAVGLTRLIELHRDVRFDIFHANWPYGGELMFLGKNYPNVSVDFCWANIIDPIYCQNLFKQALSSMPHGKVHGYGSDYGGGVDRAWAHASIARDNIAIALSDLVDIDYIDLDDAKQIARMWLFDNANAFFRLGIQG